MPAHSDASLAALLLTQRLVETEAKPLKASEYWALLEAVPDPALLLAASDSRQLSDLGIDPDLAGRVANRLDAATSFAFKLDEFEQAGFRVVASVDTDYPVAFVERLGRNAPPLLYVAGDPSLLSGDLLGLVGSRDVSEVGAEVARSAAVGAVRNGFGVVSGGAKGVDRLAMAASLDAGGVAVGVLADSVVRTTNDPETRRAISDGALCLCTPFKPTAGFSVANAMGRNKLIYALSRATLVVASDHDKGGTWAGAVEALKQKTARVLVWTGEGAGPGNAAIAGRGGVECTSVGDIFPIPSLERASSSMESAQQLALEV